MQKGNNNKLKNFKNRNIKNMFPGKRRNCKRF